MSDAEFLFVVFFSAAVTVARMASTAAGLGIGTADTFLTAFLGFYDISHGSADHKSDNAYYDIVNKSHNDSFLKDLSLCGLL